MRQLLNFSRFTVLFLSLFWITTGVNAMEQQLTKQQKAIVPISAFTASGDIEALKPALEQGLDSGLTINEIKEVLAQMYAYAGFPRSLNALGTFMMVVEQRKAKGIEDPQGKTATSLPTDKTSLEFGTENQTKLIGQKVAGPLFDFSPEIDQYFKAHLFGDIFQRDVLTWKDREIATVAALANLSGANSQLRSHILISMNNGVNPKQQQEIVDVIRQSCGDSIADNAQQVLDDTLASLK